MATESLGSLLEHAIDLEEIDVNTYRSKSQYLPPGARAVFGGQVVGQALAAASKTVPKNYQVHSLHSYFLLGGIASVPIVYTVKRIRDGRSYVTRRVIAKQKGKRIFTCTCSYQTEQKSSLKHQFMMPKVPEPESLISTDQLYKQWLENPDISPEYRLYIEGRLEMPFRVDVRRFDAMHPFDMWGPTKQEPIQRMWMRAEGKISDDLAVHQSIAAYCSDYFVLFTALMPHGINPFTNPRLTMIASLDHAMWFHEPFRADEWLLYELESPRSVGGRGLAFGRIFTQDGRLVVSFAQEGLIRMSETGSIQPVVEESQATGYRPRL
ncbi:Thioesterase/thiol ester dehydrase-isomerase [Basidiobolus meristosporus CBS 931.73]|uniref:Thioesterase/thiol ester dehydrase-isomerase n=1 Tax=Basidiobolus meristosporus CBS 931.73 TaxID=1314790 RepID=A0A1Y1WWD3_9FUNG|nr:Thioesterase/thiol ester dehydrase-isomerase [Basidiobolus meristosporus CBS 931.73]|eukprot:ORX77867.1 Thioesterase/thiol ester dehydrase-isomerase [Basidiobolus meristosporus CBS 931.73]